MDYEASKTSELKITKIRNQILHHRAKKTHQRSTKYKKKHSLILQIRTIVEFYTQASQCFQLKETLIRTQPKFNPPIGKQTKNL